MSAEGTPTTPTATESTETTSTSTPVEGKAEEKKTPKAPAGPPPASTVPASVTLPPDWKQQYSNAEAFGVASLVSASTHLESDNWVFNHEMDTGIKVYTRANTDGSARAVCGQAIIKASPLKVITEAGNTANWKAWDALLKGFEVTEMTPIHKAYHLTFNSYFPYGERDVCYLETKKELADGSLVLATAAIDHPKYPVTDAYVRAQLKAGGWHARPVAGDPNSTLVTYFMNTDPLLALVPTWVLNLASTRFPAIIDKLRANCGVPFKK